ncbi:MAG: hypothetical protein R2788_02225 [Saprospiraceae bacterium]
MVSCAAGHFGFFLGLIWFGQFHGRAAHQRNRYPQKCQASAGNIVGCFPKDFIKLVLIALVVAATPLAIWGVNQCATGFCLPHPRGLWWVFVVAGLSAVLIAVLSVSYQAIRAALSNLVESL